MLAQKQKVYENTIKKLYPDLKLLSKYQKSHSYVIVRDQLGIKYKVKAYSLLNNKPTIMSAVDKTDAFIKRLSVIQPNLTVLGKYLNVNTKILVKDLDNLEYKVKPNQLLRGETPSILTSIDKNKCFKTKAIKIHGDTYIYDKLSYINSYTPVTITCGIHGYFNQTPHEHLSGCGCSKCGGISKSKSKTFSPNNFYLSVKILHDNKYVYKYTDYINRNTKIEIECPVHGKFMQTPKHHLKGGGCNKCNSTGWSKTAWIKRCLKNKKSAKVYIIRCFKNGEAFIKIGITFREICLRFTKNFPYSYEVLREIKGSPDFVWNKEVELHRLCKSFKYKPLLSFPGETECFTLEALTLLKEYL